MKRIDSMIDAAPALAPWRTVLEAVVEGGDLLRAEFLREGGPRGKSVHDADIDPVVEAHLQERLTARWPDDGWLGEETSKKGRARSPRNGSRRVWVVDPNDGTSAYMRGFRGSAVSVGLLEDGRPILGVVHAHNWPDDDGCLIAWAEGGPVVRDGVAIEPGGMPAIGEQVVLVSQSADRNPEGNLRCVHPRRYRAIPSIALRLALVAAGEAVAGVSMALPTAWDLCAGAALLRGAGGVLLNGQGESLVFGADGHLRSEPTDLVVGGHRPVCEELVKREWHAVMNRPVTGEDPFWRLAWPARGRVVRDAGAVQRAQGALLGLLSGDALGSQAEFMNAGAIADRFPEGIAGIHGSPLWHTLAGQPTDDGEMALVLARMLVRDGDYLPEAAFEGYKWWYATRPFDVGNTVSRALHGHPDATSEANGALMRCAPLGIWGWHADPETLARIARDDAALTHPGRRCRDANALFVRAIAEAVRNGPEPSALYERIRDWAQAPDIDPEVRQWVVEAADTLPEDFTRHAGWIRTALGNALWHLARGHGPERAMIETVARGGDTDTNAAIVGALLGAVHGAGALPAQWLRMVSSCRALAGFEGVQCPRPPALWPVDAALLAEQLLLAGTEAACEAA